MAHYFRILGRVIRSHAFERAVTVTTAYVVSEMRLADLKVKRAIIKRKHSNHLRLLGKTVFRLHKNNIESLNDEHITRIIRVLDEIKVEIDIVEQELKRRLEIERRKRRKQAGGR